MPLIQLLNNLNYIIISIFTVILLIFIFRNIGIDITKATFEDKSKVKVINNSFLDTFKNFIDKSDYDFISGKVIFFNTWASWCGSCIKEIPTLNHLHSFYFESEKIVFVSYCSDLNTGSIPEFLKKRNLELNYKFLNSSEGLRTSLRTILSSKPNEYKIDPLVDIIPMNFIIDQNEKILYYKEGSLSQNDLTIITSILNGLLK